MNIKYTHVDVNIDGDMCKLSLIITSLNLASMSQFLQDGFFLKRGSAKSKKIVPKLGRSPKYTTYAQRNASRVLLENWKKSPCVPFINE